MDTYGTFVVLLGQVEKMLELLIVKGGSNVKLQDAQGPLRAGRSLIFGWRPRLTWQGGRSK